MSVFAERLIRVLSRWAPDAGTRACRIRDGASLDTSEKVSAVPLDRSSAVSGPDWQYVWETLLAASANASQIKELLGRDRTFFDFRDITDAAEALRKQIGSAYSLMCTAPRMEGLEIAAGDDMDDVRRAVDLQRAEIIDAELAPMVPEAAGDSPTWKINHADGGGFVATSVAQVENGATPWKFWGIAPTARSAAHTLTWYFLDRPPRIEFDPLHTARPYARVGPASDRSLEGPATRDLLERRGPIYEEHIAACRSARSTVRERADRIRDYLRERAAELNATDPQLDECGALEPVGSPQNHDHGGVAHTVQWIPSRLIVGTHHSRWGDFGGHRNDVPCDIATGLLAGDLEDFTDELFGVDEISLLCAPGWAGPLYWVGANGNHRIHAARMLNLPWVAAAVTVEAPAPSWDMLGLVADDPCPEESEQHELLEERLHERTQLIAGLIRRGVIIGELTKDDPHPVLRCRRLPASWLLRPARYTTTVNAIYESRYPGALAQLGIPAEIGTDPVSWTRWLTSAAER